MQFFINPNNQQVFAYADDAQHYIAAALAAGWIACAREPSPMESWDASSQQWVVDATKMATQFNALKRAAWVTIDECHTASIQQLAGNPTQAEKDTWALKLATASAITNNTPVSAESQAFLASAGLISDVAKNSWAASVLVKSAAYAQIIGLAEKRRETARSAVKAATDAEALKTALAAQRVDAAVDATVPGSFRKKRGRRTGSRNGKNVLGTRTSAEKH